MNTNHDVNALVSMATDHADKWGDSCHHALAEEIVRLRAILSDPLIKAAPDLKAVLCRIMNAHESGNNGAYMGEAVLCQMFADQARRAIAKAEGVK